MPKKSFNSLLLKYIFYNNRHKCNLIYKIFFKDFNQEISKNISIYFFELFLKKKTYYSKIRLKCHFNLKSRAILTKFMLNRIPFKQLASNGLIQGVRKAN
jgi:ribosomal protein S14